MAVRRQLLRLLTQVDDTSAYTHGSRKVPSVLVGGGIPLGKDVRLVLAAEGLGILLQKLLAKVNAIGE